MVVANINIVIGSVVVSVVVIIIAMATVLIIIIIIHNLIIDNVLFEKFITITYQPQLHLKSSL